MHIVGACCSMIGLVEQCSYCQAGNLSVTQLLTLSIRLGAAPLASSSLTITS